MSSATSLIIIHLSEHIISWLPSQRVHQSIIRRWIEVHRRKLIVLFLCACGKTYGSYTKILFLWSQKYLQVQQAAVGKCTDSLKCKFMLNADVLFELTCFGLADSDPKVGIIYILFLPSCSIYLAELTVWKRQIVNSCIIHLQAVAGQILQDNIFKSKLICQFLC